MFVKYIKPVFGLREIRKREREKIEREKRDQVSRVWNAVK
jgi:hypothetical protein